MTTDATSSAVPFVRPNDSIVRRLVNRRLLPPPPLPHLAFDFGKLRPANPGKVLLLGIVIEVTHVAISLGLIHLWRGFAIAPITVFIGLMTWLAIDHPNIMMTIVLGGAAALFGAIIFSFARNSGAQFKQLKHGIRDWFRDERDRAQKHATNWRAVRAAGGDKSVRVPLRHKTRMITQMVIIREQWLRQGSENWTKPERLKACMASSLCVIPISVTSLSEFMAHSLFAALYMGLYLRAYRQSGSQREAVLHTVHIHRAINRAIILVVLLNVFIAYVNFDLFMSIHGH